VFGLPEDLVPLPVKDNSLSDGQAPDPRDRAVELALLYLSCSCNGRAASAAPGAPQLRDLCRYLRK